MTALESLRVSDAWDAETDLPLNRLGQNPWIYMAYIDAVLRLNGEKLPSRAIIDFFHECSVPYEFPLFYRLPGGRGGPNSHDEVMGAFSLFCAIKNDPTALSTDRVHATYLMNYLMLLLEGRRGDFNSHQIKIVFNPFERLYRAAWLKVWSWVSAIKDKSKIASVVRDLMYNKSSSFLRDPKWKIEWNPLRYNIYRFVWLRPFLLACANRNPGLIAQRLWCLRLLTSAKSDANTAKTGPKPRLMNWLMAIQMVKDRPLCAWAFAKYRKVVEASSPTLSHDLRQEPEGLRNTAFISQFARDKYEIS